MKKVIMVMTMVLALCASVVSAQEVEDIGGPTRLKAQMISNFEIERYVGEFYHDRVTKAGPPPEEVRGEFELNAEFEVTYLEINGVVLHDDADNPRPTLPGNVVGEVRGFSLSVRAYVSGNDRTVLWGHTYDQFLERGEAVSVELRVQQVRQFLPYTLPVGYGREDVDILDADDNWVGSYDERDGGFWIYVDPDDALMTYFIVDRRTGDVIETGTTSVVTGPEESADHALNVGYEDGIEVIDFTSNTRSREYREQTFDGIDIVDGVEVPVKTFVIHREEGDQASSVWLSGFIGCVDVFQVVSSGPMPRVPFYIGEAVEIADGPGDIVVVLYGDEDPDGVIDEVRVYNYPYGGGGRG